MDCRPTSKKKKKKVYFEVAIKIKITSSFPRDKHDISFITITVFGLRVILYLTKKHFDEIFLPTVKN